MKILLSAYSIDPSLGSEWGISWAWLTEYLRLGHEVVCLTSCWGDDNRQRLEQGIRSLAPARVRVEFVELPAPFRGARDARSLVGVYSRYLLWQRVAAGVAKRLDAQHDFDLVQHVSWGSLQLASGMWRLGKPLLFGPVGGGQVAPREFRAYFEQGWRKERWRDAISWTLCHWSRDYHQVLRHADHILVVNPETRRMAERGRATVEQSLEAPFSVEHIPDHPPSRGESRELRLLWVGRLMPRKGLPLVLDALSRLRDVPCRLTIIGDGEMSGRVPHWLKQYGVEDRVEWRGQTPFEEVKRAYRDHDVFLFATLRDSNACQLVEAMAFALPVVTLDIHGGATLVPDEAGVKVPVTTPEETAAGLAEGVRQLAANTDLRRTMGHAGFRFVHDQILPWRRDFLQRYLAKFEEKAPAANK